MKHARFGPLLVALLLATGCLTDPTAVYRRSGEQAADIRERVEEVSATDERGLVREHDEPYLDSRPITRPSGHSHLDEKVSVHVEDLPLELVMEKAGAQLSRPITIIYTEDRHRDPLVTLRFDGTFETLLEACADFTGLGYDLGEHGSLFWNETITRTYMLWRIPGTRAFSLGGSASSSSALSGGGGGVAAGPTSSDSVSLRSSGNFWNELQNALRAIMSGEGDNIIISESLGSVTVTGLAANVRAAGRHIQKLNEELSRQILLEIQVLEVASDDGANVGVDWRVFRETLAEGLLPAVASVEFGPANSAQGTAIPTFTVRGQRAGTSAEFALHALREQGTVSVQTSPRVVTLNGEVARVLLLEDRGYVSDTETTVSEGVFSTEITQGTISTGVALHILPRIVSGDILLQTSISISNLRDLTNVSAGTTTLQLPSVQRNIFYQNSLLQTGQLLVIGGIRRKRASLDNTHLPGVKALGSQAGQVSESETVLLITPTLIAGGNPRP